VTFALHLAILAALGDDPAAALDDLMRKLVLPLR